MASLGYIKRPWMGLGKKEEEKKEEEGDERKGRKKRGDRGERREVQIHKSQVNARCL